jgi:tetratricopeptide (TPR) repeat protein
MENSDFWEKEAIKASFKGAWDQAIELNQRILKHEPKNVSALNRLGQAFWKKGDFASAKKAYQQALAIDRYNNIASKNLKRLADQKKSGPKKGALQEAVFLEEPGKTKIVKLARLASPDVLSGLDSGDQVLLAPKKHAISITTPEGAYLGILPDDLSHHLLFFIKGGNQYQALVKSVDRQSLEIFIRETKRAAKFANQPSFIQHYS